MILLLITLILYAIITTAVLIAHHKWLAALSTRIDADRATTHRLP